jgi:hypothetical protein
MKKDHYVAPHTLKSELDLRNLDSKIDYYEQRLFGWFIKIAKALRKDPSDPEGGPGADPVALMIIISLFEAHGVFLQGNNTPRLKGKGKNKEPKSKENFEYGFLEFLSKKHSEWPKQKQKDIAKMAYKYVRCGLFHLNSTRKGIWYDRGPDEEHPNPPIDPRYHNKKLVKITFNVPAFVLEVEEYFQEYVAELRDTKSQSRKSFAEGWKIVQASLRTSN